MVEEKPQVFTEGFFFKKKEPLAVVSQFAQRFDEISKSSEGEIRPEIKAVVDEIESIEVEDQEIARKAIVELAEHDGGVKKLIDQRKIYIDSMGDLVDQLEQVGLGAQVNEDLLAKISACEAVDQLVTKRFSLSKGRQVSSRIIAIQENLNRNKPERAIYLARQAMETAENPQLVWDHLVDLGVIPPNFLEDVETVSTLVAVKNIWEAVADSNLVEEEKQIVLAHCLLPLCQQGKLEPEFAKEIVEVRQRFDFPLEDFTQATIAGFLGLADELESHGLSKRTKIAIAALSACFLFANVAPLLQVHAEYPGFKPDKPKDIKPDQLKADQEKIDKQIGSSEPGGIELGDIVSPENSPFLNEVNVWEINKTLKPEGLYRLATADKFIPWKFGWEINRSPWDQVPVRNLPQSLELTANFSDSHNIDIPIPYGFFPNPEHSKAMIGDQEIPFTIKANKDGSFYIVFDTAFHSVKGQLSVGMSKGELDTGMSTLATEHPLDTDKLPTDVQAFLTSLIDSPQMTNEQMASAVKDFAKDYFTYSLNPGFSDYYKQSQNSGEYFNRLFEAKRGDCDVVNSSVVMMLRHLGIPSRMAFGFKNDGFTLNKDFYKLSSLEMHGWAEAYIDGQWTAVDGTPAKMDAYTRKVLADQFDISDLSGSVEGVSAEESVDSLLVSWYALKSWFKNLPEDHPEATGFGGGALLALSGLVPIIASHIMKARSQKRMDYLEHKLENKISQVYGKSHRFAKGVRRLFTRLTKSGERLNNYGDGLGGAALLPLNPKFWRAYARKERAVRLASKGMEQLETKSTSQLTPDIPDVLDFVCDISGKTPEQVESAIVESNKSDLLDVSSSQMKMLTVKTIQYSYGLVYRNFFPESMSEEAKKFDNFEDFCLFLQKRVFNNYRRRLRGPRKKSWLEEGIKKHNFPNEFEDFQSDLGDLFERAAAIFWGIANDKF
jgi:hypothetical protein